MHLLPVLIPLIAAFVGMIGAILSVLGFARPGRIPRPRRLVNYRVHYDDWLGARPDIKGVAELVVRRKGQDVPDASLAMIRISNEGGLDIGKEHWVMPINFTFDGRDVIGVEVSDTDRVPPGLLVGDQEQERLDNFAAGLSEGQTIQISKGKKALALPRIELKRKDRIRLLVLLSGPRDHLRPGVEGDAYIKGAGRRGGLAREGSPRREALYTFGWTGFALISLVAAILVTLVVKPFAPSVEGAAQRLERACASSAVQTNPGGSTIGSVGAAADLQDSGASASVRGTHLVMSDGQVSPVAYPSLVPHPVAIVIFSVVVNRAAGVSSLTRDQLVGIWTGRYTNWRQLGGANLHIDIVSRTTDSGTRATFDHKILGTTTEIAQSSDTCTSPDLISRDPVIRCEKSSTGQLLTAVNLIPGAIGYAESAAATSPAYPDVDQMQLGGRDANPQLVNNGQYPFWAVEYLYTYGKPAPGSLLSAFLSYMATDTAASVLQSEGDIPCGLTTLCAA
jgi:phosphate transport system substrate-binding protein